MFLYFCIVFLSLSFASVGQTSLKPIDEQLIETWQDLSASISVSDDGKYLSYLIENKPVKSSTLILRAIKSNWQKEIVGIRGGYFHNNSKKFIYSINDSLYFVQLGTEQVSSMAGISSFQVFERNSVQFLAYKMNEEFGGDFILENLKYSGQKRFGTISQFYVDRRGSHIILQRNNGKSAKLEWIDMDSDRQIEVFNDTNASIGSIELYDNGKQVAFLVYRGDNAKPEVWHFRDGFVKAAKIIDSNTVGVQGKTHVVQGLSFHPGGNYLTVKLAWDLPSTPIPEGPKLNVWSHKDAYLQSFQITHPNFMRKRFTVAVSTHGTESKPVLVTLLSSIDEAIIDVNDEHALIRFDSSGDRYWLTTGKNYFLVHLKDGVRSKFILNQNGGLMKFTPGGKYLIYQDKARNSLWSYDLQTDERTQIIDSLQIKRFLDRDSYHQIDSLVDNPNYVSSFIGIAGWLPNDEAVLLYDEYDIWIVNLKGNQKPRNVTNSFGQRNHLKFRFFRDEEVIRGKSSLILPVYNTKTKESGFYSTSIESFKDPVLRTLGPYTYFRTSQHLPAGASQFTENIRPTKARNANIWIVCRQSNNEAPNLYFTRDFNTFTATTNFYPHKGYNWPSSELVHFRQLDQTMGQGILYKPSNFDPRIKYPVIVTFYSNYTHHLNEFFRPYYTNDAHIDVPWFTSRGYLVFVPDIKYYISKYGPSALNAVEAAAMYLGRLPYVDSSRLGISAHSMAGSCGYYILTRSKRFSAALIGAGSSDLVSTALFISRPGIATGSSRQDGVENNYGFSLWDSFDLYVSQSPILYADKIVTPLLIFHCKNDGALPWEQGVEMYLALRRLQKSVWMLEYDEGTHSVNGNDAHDFTYRLTQYFNHLLKNDLPPKWMTKGISASLKGRELGYDLDTVGVCGPNCPACN